MTLILKLREILFYQTVKVSLILNTNVDELKLSQLGKVVSVVLIIKNALYIKSDGHWNGFIEKLMFEPN